MELLKIIMFAVKEYSIGVMDFLMNPVAWIFILSMYMMYRRNSVLQRVMYGKKIKHAPFEVMASSILFGLLGGLIGSLAISAIGISFYENTSILIIIFISLALMFINPRYICFSYSGGMWSIFVLIFTSLSANGVIKNQSVIANFISNEAVLDVTAILAMIAIMHFVEALLIIIDGDKGALPIFMKKDDKVIGAFIMQRFWIIPMLLYVIIQQSTGGSDGIAVPQWWPLIKPALPGNIIKNAIFSVVTFVIMMGYSDMAVTMDVRKKVKRSSIGLALYSIILLILSILSLKYYPLKYIAAFFAPIGHEALILYEQYMENKRKPKWQYTEDGIIVLDTTPGAPAEAMGIKSGEIVIGLNNISVKSMEDADNILKEYPNYLWAEVMDDSGNKRTLEYKDYVNGIRSLGIITVPQHEYGIPLVQEKDGFVRRQLYKMKGRKNKKK